MTSKQQGSRLVRGEEADEAPCRPDARWGPAGRGDTSELHSLRHAGVKTTSCGMAHFPACTGRSGCFYSCYLSDGCTTLNILPKIAQRYLREIKVLYKGKGKDFHRKPGNLYTA